MPAAAAYDESNVNVKLGLVLHESQYMMSPLSLQEKTLRRC